MPVAGTSTSGSLLGPDWKQVSHEAWAELNDDEYEEEEEEVGLIQALQALSDHSSITSSSPVVIRDDRSRDLRFTDCVDASRRVSAGCAFHFQA
jgi:hypothetical protein